MMFGTLAEIKFEQVFCKKCYGIKRYMFGSLLGIAVGCLQITPIWKEGHLAAEESKYILRNHLNMAFLHANENFVSFVHAISR